MKKIDILINLVFISLFSACSVETPTPANPQSPNLNTNTPAIEITKTEVSKKVTPEKPNKGPETAQPVSNNHLQVINSEGAVNVRSGPGTYYPVVGSLKNNDSITGIGIDESGQWIQFDRGGAAGLAWIFVPFTNFDRDTSHFPVVNNIPTPAVTLTPQPPRAMGKIKITYTDGPVNVRSGPDTKYALLGKVKNGDTLNATGTIDSGDWVQIQFADAPDGVGWIFTDYCNYDRSSRTLPLIQDLPPTPAP